MGEKQRGLNTSETESYSRWWFKGCLVPRSDREGLTALQSLKPLVVSLVGSQMASLIGMSGLFFTTLGEGDVNIEMISQGASEIIISCVIKGRDEALNLVHQSCLSEPVEEREVSLSCVVTWSGLLILTMISSRALVILTDGIDYLLQRGSQRHSHLHCNGI